MKYFKNEDAGSLLLAFLIIVVVFITRWQPGVSFGWSVPAELGIKIFTVKNCWAILGLYAFLVPSAVLIAKIQDFPVANYLNGFSLLLFLALLSFVLAGQGNVKSAGFEYVLFALALGLALRTVIGVPEWLKNSLQSEFFVKIGLVVLGTGILFGDLLKAGTSGLVQAALVVLAVWYVAYGLCRWFKVDDELSYMVSSAVSICGVSAAIATAGAINGDKRKLSFVVSIVMVTALPMMIAMPYLAQWLQLSPAVTGAWLGGTIDTTGAVVASGALAGEEALKIATIVKFSQNVLLGLAAFLITIVWSVRPGTTGKEADKPGLSTIWSRFPKFVLGFIAASLVFSFLVSSDTNALVKDTFKWLQQVWFAMAFVSIGIETDFKEFSGKDYRSAIWAFLGAQLFNILFTLAIAWWLFS